MECKKCGKKISKNVKFCTNCGEKVVLEEEVKETKSTVQKAVEKRAEVKKEANETKPVENKTSGLAIAGMILGILGLLLSFFIGPFAFLLPLLGLIFSLVSKNGKGFKIAGIITSVIALLIEVIILLLGIFVFSSIFSFIGSNPDYLEQLEERLEEKYDDYDYDYDHDDDYDLYGYKGESPYGTWTCAPFEDEDGYNADIDDADDEDKTTLKLSYSDKYEYGPYEDLYKNHYSGSFTYEIEKDKNEQNKSNGYKFIMVKGEVDEFMKDGIKESTEGKALNFEMELFKDYKYDKALIIFPSTYNMYICER